jgi:signal transduction histidine kinase
MTTATLHSVEASRRPASGDGGGDRVAEHGSEPCFERFFRSSSATAQAIPGTGLGLTIAQAIVEGHGGRISVESEEGVGTTFRVQLPIERPVH